MPERCDACGFDGGRHDDDALVVAVRALGPAWRQLLADADAAGHLRQRPAPAVWSAIEYAEHTRDILALHAWAVEQALTTDEPAVPAVDEGLADAAAATYGHADPAVVAGELGDAAERLVAGIDAGGWRRGFTIGDDRRDVRALVEHALHDATHHLDDVRRGLGTLSS